MTGANPDPDGRRRDELLAEARSKTPAYTEAWDADADDVGATMLELFADLAETVTERVDRVPEKHRVAFYEALGFDQLPPRPARLPLSVTLADGVGENVPVPAGTRAVGGSPEQTFEILENDAFEATPARLTDAFSVAPEDGEIYEHGAIVDEGRARLFQGDGSQRHHLHVGHAGQLDVEGSPQSPTTVRVELATETPASVLASDLEWEFYGNRGGETGWHRVQATAVEGEPTATGRQDRLRAIEDEVPRRAIDLDVDGAVAETTVDGVESRWGRCRLPRDEWESDLLGLRIGPKESAPTYEPPVAVGPVQSGRLEPDTLLAAGTEVAPDETEPIYPLGREPRPQDAFYVGCTEAFTKAGTQVELVLDTFEQSASFTIDAEIAWEYWDGDAWSRLDLAEGVGEDLRDLRGGDGSQASVGFRVPEDLAENSVAGHDGHWIRARLRSGSYGRFTSTKKTPSNQPDYWTTTHEVAPPTIGDVSLRYTEQATAPVSHLVPENNLAYGPDLVTEERRRFRPFVGLPDDEQALYLGFDRPLEGGPITLLVAVAERAYEAGFYSGVRWERRTSAGAWTKLDATDGTEGLTERGIVELGIGKPTVASARFGRQRHWVRARVSRDQFSVDGGQGAMDGNRVANDGGQVPMDADQVATRADHGSSTAGTDGGASHTDTDLGGDARSMAGGGGTNRPTGDCGCGDGGSMPDPCSPAVETEPPAGDPGREPPTVTGLYPNTGWAHNVRTVEDELVGSSDGTQDQRFSLASPPATEIEVWVDELAALSGGRRRALAGAESPAVEAETGPDGEPSAFWVRWTAVEDFLDSEPDDRHYTVDPSDGEVQFGDGTRGQIPPRGRDNVRASYRTGGGTSGNLPAGAVADLKDAIPFVDAVMNPLPADGGANEETVEGVLDRAPKALRDRGRAVTEADVERIALDASRELARARCISAMNRAAEHAPGWVTLLVVPRASAEKPVPSVTLREQVRTAVAERAAATLVADPDQLVVRGPSYVGVSVAATVATTGVGSRTQLEEAASTTVAEYLNPLDGGPDGEGWGFGEVPCHSDVYALLEAVDGVDHVEDLVLEFEGTGQPVAVRDGDPDPSLPPDALVHSEEHDIRTELTTEGGA